MTEVEITTLEVADPLQIVVTDITGAVEASEQPGPTEILTITIPAPTTVVVNEPGIQGSPGPIGLTGPTGPRGLTGAGHDPVLFTQDLPLSEWVIPHPFPDRPSVTVTDHLGDEIDVDIQHAPGVVTIRTALPATGRAYLI
jgi:hypothetical protein